MEMFILSEVSRQLLERETLKTDDVGLWNEAFEACASPSEWKDFLTRHRKEAFSARLEEIYTQLQRTYQAPLRRVRTFFLED
jgi:hypothetical protein